MARFFGGSTVSEVDGARQKVNAELSPLVKAGKIEKVKRGVYRGSPEASSINETEDAALIIVNPLCAVSSGTYNPLLLEGFDFLCEFINFLFK